MQTVCVDFINEFHEQESFVFYPKDLNDPNVVIGSTKYTNAEEVGSEGINLGTDQGQIRKCAKGCNSDWTDCAK